MFQTNNRRANRINHNQVVVLTHGTEGGQTAADMFLADINGLIAYRQDAYTVDIYDGSDWSTYNSAGWALKFDAQFPDTHCVPEGHWAILDAVKLVHTTQWLGYEVDKGLFTWAIRSVVPTQTTQHRTPKPTTKTPAARPVSPSLHAISMAPAPYLPAEQCCRFG